MKTSYLCAIGIFCLFISCINNSYKQSSIQDNKISQTDISNDTPLDSLIEKLKLDKYELVVDTSYKQILCFVSHKDISDPGDTLRLHTQKVITIEARRNYPISNTLFYPKLKIQQIRLNAPEDIDGTFERIFQIITNESDIYNEKIYDRIRKSGQDLIYIESRAKIFEAFVLYYDSYLEKLINAR